MKPFRHQTALYIIAFLLALAVRLIRLGTWTLTDLEAQWALQALGVAQGAHPALGSNPAYVLLTTIVFFFYGGGTNFWARFVPALAGSCLVFVPFLFRERLKPRPSLILAFFLAFDPGLVALSRQAGSSILAVTFVLFAWGFWQRKQSRLAGVFAGLALLSGASLWEGLLGLGLTWAILQAMEARRKTESAYESRARRMVVCVMVWNWDSARRRNIILFIAQWVECVVIIFAGIFERLDAFIGNLGGHDDILVDRLSTIGGDPGIDCHCARLDEWKPTRDAAEHMGVGRFIAGVVLSIPSGERLGLDAHSVVVIGRIGIGARRECLAGRTTAGDRRGRTEHIYSFLRLAPIFIHHHTADPFFGSQ